MIGWCSAVKIVLEPVFEADMLPCSYGLRPKRSAHDGLQVLIDESWRGRLGGTDRMPAVNDLVEPP
jgi:retron-type reverse transcriptase